MDIVIPVAEQPRNETLVFALSSIEKHTRLTPVVMGYTRNWGAAAAKKYRVRDIFQIMHQPNRNTDAIMREACLDPGITDPFVWSNDDIFFTRPVPLTELLEQGAMALGSLYDVENKGLYGRQAHATLKLLQEAGKPVWNYERHVPLVVHKADMLRALNFGGAKRSVYQNLRRQMPYSFGLDVKVFKKADHVPTPDESPFFSVGNDYPIELVRSTLS